MSGLPPTTTTTRLLPIPEADEAEEENEISDLLLSLSFHNPQTGMSPIDALGNREIEVLSLRESHRISDDDLSSCGFKLSPQELKEISLGWDHLNQLTSEDPKVPETTLYPSQYASSSNSIQLKPMTNPKTGEPFNICANWIVNPYDKTHKVAVFQYPNEGEGIEYWKCIQMNELALIDLRSDSDLEKMESNPEPLPFYPVAGGPPVVSPEGSFHITGDEIHFCKNLYSVKIKHSPDLEAIGTDHQVLHFPFWDDGRGVSIDDLDILTYSVVGAKNVGIHCKAGVGRTGTLATASFIRKLIEEGHLEKENFTLDWLNHFILQLRQQRSKDWVHRPIQYALLYKFGLWLFENQRKKSSTSPYP